MEPPQGRFHAYGAGNLTAILKEQLYFNIYAADKQYLHKQNKQNKT
jgi:hypothetical protein